MTKRFLYQLFTDDKGHFAVGKKGSQLMEYEDISGMLYGKIIDSRMILDGSVTEEYVQDWIEELKEAEVLDIDGNIIYQEL
ncbi:MAG: hypothetical protein ACR2F1_07995 [Nitrososphaeraceae archaeon]